MSLVQLNSVVILIAVLLVAGFAVQLTLGLSFAYVRELVALHVAATAVAFQTAVGLAGAFVASIAGGAVIGAAGYIVAFLTAGVLAALGAVKRGMHPNNLVGGSLWSLGRLLGY